MYRTRSSTKKYDKVMGKEACPFCDPDPAMFVAETPYAYILKAKYPYDAWDNQTVLEHLLVTPKRHVASLDELTDKEKLAIMKLYGEYEHRGYDIYARGINSVGRTVGAHQHAHLIRPNGKRNKFLFYIEKPYWMVKG